MLQFSPGTSFYGTGEVSGQLERTGKRVSHSLNNHHQFVSLINLVSIMFRFLLGTLMHGDMALEPLRYTSHILGY